MFRNVVDGGTPGRNFPIWGERRNSYCWRCPFCHRWLGISISSMCRKRPPGRSRLRFYEGALEIWWHGSDLQEGEVSTTCCASDWPWSVPCLIEFPVLVPWDYGCHSRTRQLADRDLFVVSVKWRWSFAVKLSLFNLWTLLLVHSLVQLGWYFQIYSRSQAQNVVKRESRRERSTLSKWNNSICALWQTNEFGIIIMEKEDLCWHISKTCFVPLCEASSQEICYRRADPDRCRCLDLNQTPWATWVYGIWYKYFKKFNFYVSLYIFLYLCHYVDSWKLLFQQKLLARRNSGE